MTKRKLILKYRRRLEQLECMQSLLDKRFSKPQVINFCIEIEKTKEFISDLKKLK